jgi:hypothetical protein
MDMFIMGAEFVGGGLIAYWVLSLIILFICDHM